MDLIRKIQKDYGPDIFGASILILIFLFLASIFTGRIGVPIVDCFGPGVYIPWEISEGKILYKDVFGAYGPFSYQFNALLFLLFGQSLNPIFAAGLVNTIIILTTLYLITRTLSSPIIAFTVTYTVMVLCAFHYYIFNFIFPYGYAIAYALSAFLLSVLFCIYYIRSSKPEFLSISFFFMGVSILSKLDFIIFLGVLLVIAIFLKPITKKYLIISFLSLIIAPIISWSVLFIQGLTISDIANYLYYFKRLISSPLLKEFYEHYTGMNFNIIFIKNSTVRLGLFLMTAYLSARILYFLFIAINRTFRHQILRQLSKLSLIIITSMILFIAIVKIQKYHNIGSSIFSWTALTATLMLIVILIQIFSNQKFNIKTIFSQQTYEKICSRDKIFILISVAGLIEAIRSYYFIDLHSFGTFFLPLVLLVNVVFIADYLPNYLKLSDKKVWTQVVAITLIAIVIPLSLKYISIVKRAHKYPIKTERGTIYTLERFATTSNKAIKYINETLPKDVTFIAIPQAPYLNFLTNRKSHGWYNDLVPLHVEMFGEDKIMNDLSANPPDYIVRTQKHLDDWGFLGFGIDYAIKIDQFIAKNYELKKAFGTKKFWIAIFEKKSKNSNNSDESR